MGVHEKILPDGSGSQPSCDLLSSEAGCVPEIGKDVGSARRTRELGIGAAHPYDLRHACITRWLNAGVPIAEIARRVGNSPEVIHRRYHGCIDGHEEAANAKITKALEEEGDAA
ncbi:hypothetical protein ACW4TU_13350 [Streptomyces sp. QTS52]